MLTLSGQEAVYGQRSMFTHSNRKPKRLAVIVQPASIMNRITWVCGIQTDHTVSTESSLHFLSALRIIAIHASTDDDDVDFANRAVAIDTCDVSRETGCVRVPRS